MEVSAVAKEMLATAEQLNGFLADFHTAPVIDRRFFVGDAETHEPGTELKLLLDPDLGLPYPLMPPDQLLPTNDGDVANWHHAMFPHCDPRLKSAGGIVMRSAQIQLVRREQHNHGADALHRAPHRPFIHSDPAHQLGVALMAASGAEHRLAIETSDRKLWLVPMSSEKVAHLQIEADLIPVQPEDITKLQAKRPDLTREQAKELLEERRQRQAALERRYMRYGYGPMRVFFKEQVFAQDLGNVKQRVIDQFLLTGSQEKGLELLGVAAKELVKRTVTYNGETMADLYKRLFIAGRLGKSVPMTAAAMVNHKLGDVQGRLQLLDEFRGQLAERRHAA